MYTAFTYVTLNIVFHESMCSHKSIYYAIIELDHTLDPC